MLIYFKSMGKLVNFFLLETNVNDTLMSAEL